VARVLVHVGDLIHWTTAADVILLLYLLLRPAAAAMAMHASVVHPARIYRITDIESARPS
jgi:hypothetical protein